MWRVAIVLALLVCAAVALRGQLPGTYRFERQSSTNPTLSLVAVVALLAVALTILTFALLTRTRKAPSSVQDAPHALSGERGELRTKWVVIALAIMLGWLLVVVLVARLGAPTAADQPSNRRASPPGTPAAPSPDAKPPDPTGAGDVTVRYLIVATVVLMVILTIGFIVQVSRRQAPVPLQRVHPFEPAQRRVGSETLVRAAELGLREIGDASRDPRAAIIACYAAMERGLAAAPGAVPLDSDTPSEVLARAVDHHAVSTDSATELVQLFTEARFSPHVMTEMHRDNAVVALRQVLADLRVAS